MSAAFGEMLLPLIVSLCFSASYAAFPEAICVAAVLQVPAVYRRLPSKPRSRISSPENAPRRVPVRPRWQVAAFAASYQAARVIASDRTSKATGGVGPERETSTHCSPAAEVTSAPSAMAI